MWSTLLPASSYGGWKGGLGGNGFSAFGAFVLTAILTSEVILMVMTWIGNKRRVKEAAEQAAREATERATRETAKRVHREWEDWYESAKADLDAGRVPSVPPPSEESGERERRQ